MKITPVKTHKVTIQDTSLLRLIDRYIPSFAEDSILAVTSKVVALCERRVQKGPESLKEKIAKKEAEWYLPRSASKYNFLLTIKRSMLIASSGVDESNGKGYFVLWPKDPDVMADIIREHLLKKHKLKRVGVILTDSHVSPMRWGVTGIGLSYSGFSPLNDYRGKKDIFGRTLKVSQANIADGLAAAAVAAMGEGKEQTPLALIEDIPFVQFQKRNPTKKERKALSISKEEDLYAPLLELAPWRRGGS